MCRLHRNALSSAKKSVRIRRKLAKLDWDQFAPGLALSLHNLAIHGDHNDAAPHIRESVQILSKLVDSGRLDLSPALAQSLANLATFLDHKEALSTIRTAVSMFREISAGNPDRFLPSVATALYLKADCEYKLTYYRDALISLEEAIPELICIFNAGSLSFADHLAKAFALRGDCHEKLGNIDAAVNSPLEGLKLFLPIFPKRKDTLADPSNVLLLSYWKRCRSLERDLDLNVIRPYIASKAHGYLHF